MTGRHASGPEADAAELESDRRERRDAFVKASSHRVWRITAVACAAILGLGLGFAAVVQTNAQRDEELARDRQIQQQQADAIACVRAWAEAYSARANLIQKRTQPRTDAEDALILAVPRAGSDPAEFRRLLRAYAKASNELRQTQRDHPLPPSPAFTCGLEDGQKPPRPYRPGAGSLTVPPATRSSSSTNGRRTASVGQPRITSSTPTAPGRGNPAPAPRPTPSRSTEHPTPPASSTRPPPPSSSPAPSPTHIVCLPLICL